MSEIRVNNGNIEEALKNLKDNVLEMEFYKRFVKENIMKNLVLREKRNQRLLEKESFN